MLENTLELKNQSNGHKQLHRRIIDTTYHNNQNSNYTENIERLDSQFNYESNKDYYWGPPELSIFYGTSLYDQASSSQKLALNHLYWTTQYNQTAATEANAILYNQITEGVFSAFGGCDVLCQELSLETAQEHHHIHAFHSVSYKTKKGLFGDNKLKVFRKNKTIKNKLIINREFSELFPLLETTKNHWKRYQEVAFRLINDQLVQNNQTKIYSDYFKKMEKENEQIPIQTTGLLGQVIPKSFSKFVTLNFGTSPFLACVFYATRYLANILLKNYEYRYLQYYRDLAKTEAFIPIPTAISYYHMLDESFHTNISKLIAQDLYKEFTKPTLYEKFMANSILHRSQSLLLGGLSAVMPATFRNDSLFITPLYQILRSSIFEMSQEEAVDWLEKCLCHEHEGFHLNLKWHQHLLSDLRKAFYPIDYLWTVNRELGVMASANSINKNIISNRQSFAQFKKTIEHDLE